MLRLARFITCKVHRVVVLGADVGIVGSCIHRRHIYHVLNSRSTKPTLNDVYYEPRRRPGLTALVQMLPLANLLRIPDDFVSSLLDRFNVERYDVVDANVRRQFRDSSIL